MLITATIDAYEGWDVDVVDTPGAFLSEYIDKAVIMTLQGRPVELMVTTKPSIYKKHVTIERVQQVLHVSLQKEFYGCFRSALLLYKKLVKDLEYKGFMINNYDLCVANRTTNGKQMTIIWHVDDMKISHVDKKEVTKMIEWIH